jgi:hypothetical protein
VSGGEERWQHDNLKDCLSWASRAPASSAAALGGRWPSTLSWPLGARSAHPFARPRNSLPDSVELARARKRVEALEIDFVVGFENCSGLKIRGVLRLSDRRDEEQEAAP